MGTIAELLKHGKFMKGFVIDFKKAEFDILSVFENILPNDKDEIFGRGEEYHRGYNDGYNAVLSEIKQGIEKLRRSNE